MSHFVRRLPNFEQTNRRVKTIENRQWHRNVSDYRPSPGAEESQMRWPKHCTILHQCVYEPQCHIGDEQKCDRFPAWLGSCLSGTLAASIPGVKDEHCLGTCLHQAKDLGHNGLRSSANGLVALQANGECRANDAEYRVDEDTALGEQEQCAVQRNPWMLGESQITHFHVGK